MHNSVPQVVRLCSLSSCVVFLYVTRIMCAVCRCLVPAPCRQMQVRFTNPDLCALTEQVIFADPYAQAAINRWTAPQLDEAAAGLRADTEAKAAISVLKRKFCCSADALIHGDLHTGSIMVRRGCMCGADNVSAGMVVMISTFLGLQRCKAAVCTE